MTAETRVCAHCDQAVRVAAIRIVSDRQTEITIECPRCGGRDDIPQSTGRPKTGGDAR